MTTMLLEFGSLFMYRWSEFVKTFDILEDNLQGSERNRMERKERKRTKILPGTERERNMKRKIILERNRTNITGREKIKNGTERKFRNEN